MAIRTNYTFNEFFNLIKDKVNEKAKKPSYWGEGSISRAIVQSFAYLAEFIQAQINIAWMAFRVSTAKSTHLDLRVKDFGLTRREATYAIYRQMFVGTVGRVVDVVIPSGTIIETEPNELGDILSFELLQDVTMLTTDSMVEGLVRCTAIGSRGNLDENKITVLPSPISNVASTYNIEASSNGAERETDDELRRRVADYLLGLQSGNEASIKSACYSVEGITYVDVKENDPTNGNFTAYVSTDDGIVDTLLLDLVREAINKVRAFCITFSVTIPTIQNITLELDLELVSSSYNQAEYTAQLKGLVFDYINKIRKNKITQAEIIKLLMQQSNVNNVKNVKIDGVEEDLVLASFNIAKLDLLSDITFNITNV